MHIIDIGISLLIGLLIYNVDTFRDNNDNNEDNDSNIFIPIVSGILTYIIINMITKTTPQIPFNPIFSMNDDIIRSLNIGDISLPDANLFN